MASFRPIRVAWSENADAAVLGRTIQSLLKVQLKYSRSPASQIQLFQPSWSEEERGAVLEHQLDILLKQASDSTTAHSLLSKSLQELLSIYDRARYPIRRIRILLRLWSLDIEDFEEIVRDMDTELSPASMAELTVEGTRDERLSGYLDHFRAMSITMAELQQEMPRINVLKDGLELWSSIRSRCEDLVALERLVDDVPDLITHLQSIGDYLDMKGFATMRLAVLRLITEVDELYSDKSNPDDLVLGFTYLGVQWLQLGYSGKAGLALDRARTYNQQNGVTAFASLQLHISYSQYLLAIGSSDKM
jgi:separase